VGQPAPERSKVMQEIGIVLSGCQNIRNQKNRQSEGSGSPHFGKPYAVNLNHAYEELEAILEQVSVRLDIGCVVESLDQAGR